jgi:hypothetical protein
MSTIILLLKNDQKKKLRIQKKKIREGSQRKDRAAFLIGSNAGKRRL